MSIEGFDITSRCSTNQQGNTPAKFGQQMCHCHISDNDAGRLESLTGWLWNSIHIGYTHSDHVTCTHAVQYTTQYT